MKASNRSRLALTLITMILLAGAISVPLSSSILHSHAASQTIHAASPSATALPVTFAYTGTLQTFTVPPGITSLTITAVGASGGGSAEVNEPGGHGASITGTFTVEPDAVLAVVVGGKGTVTDFGNFNFSAGGGGGGSFIWTTAGTPRETVPQMYGDLTLTSLLVAAGGGGGNRGCIGNCVETSGGDATVPPDGVPGASSVGSDGGSGGGGGTNVTGGTDGAAGVGGAGGTGGAGGGGGAGGNGGNILVNGNLVPEPGGGGGGGGAGIIGAGAGGRGGMGGTGTVADISSFGGNASGGGGTAVSAGGDGVGGRGGAGGGNGIGAAGGSSGFGGGGGSDMGASGGNGGFGGGGGGNTTNDEGAGGGGGGFSGGGGGASGGSAWDNGGSAGGGGGGSYNGGTNQVNVVGVRQGNGSVTITPVSSAATQLAFIQQPSATATVGQPFDVQPQVAVQDASKNTVMSDTSTVTLSIGPGSTGNGQLHCAGGNSQVAMNGVASFTGCSIDAAGTYIIHASDSDGTVSQSDSNPIAASCRFDPTSLHVSSSGQYPGSDGLSYYASMTAVFVPHLQGSLISLTAAETACGFSGFDWQQMITYNQPFGQLYTHNPPHNPGSNNPVIIPTQSESAINDPPLGGWTYPESQAPPLLGAYPFYYNPLYITSSTIMPDPYTLTFYDAPFNECFPGGRFANDTTLCPLPPPPSKAFVGFTTRLVGICVNTSAPMCNPAGPTTPWWASTPLFQWTWTSNFNGTTTGGVSAGIVQEVSSLQPPIPGSGTGGVTITSINDVPQTPPSVSCSATPNSLWPPNGKSVVVTVSGTIAPGTQAIPSNGTTYAVTDEYGQVQPTGNITLGPGGSYSFGIPLVASRDGTDLDGRTYVIAVRARDTIGNVGSCSATVTVPHDQGQ